MRGVAPVSESVKDELTENTIGFVPFSELVIHHASVPFAEFCRRFKQAGCPGLDFYRNTRESGIAIPFDDRPPFIVRADRTPIMLSHAYETTTPVSPAMLTIGTLARGVDCVDPVWMARCINTMWAANIIKILGGAQIFLCDADIKNGMRNPGFPWVHAIYRVMQNKGATILESAVMKTVERESSPLGSSIQISHRGDPSGAVIEVSTDTFIEDVWPGVIGYLPASQFSAALVAYGRLMTLEEATSAEYNLPVRSLERSIDSCSSTSSFPKPNDSVERLHSLADCL